MRYIHIAFTRHKRKRQKDERGVQKGEGRGGGSNWGNGREKWKGEPVGEKGPDVSEYVAVAVMVVVVVMVVVAVAVTVAA
jgi:hypothetical protein